MPEELKLLQLSLSAEAALIARVLVYLVVGSSFLYTANCLRNFLFFRLKGYRLGDCLIIDGEWQLVESIGVFSLRCERLNGDSSDDRRIICYSMSRLDFLKVERVYTVPDAYRRHKEHKG